MQAKSPKQGKFGIHALSHLHSHIDIQCGCRYQKNGLSSYFASHLTFWRAGPTPISDIYLQCLKLGIEVCNTCTECGGLTIEAVPVLTQLTKDFAAECKACRLPLGLEASKNLSWMLSRSLQISLRQARTLGSQFILALPYEQLDHQ